MVFLLIALGISIVWVFVWVMIYNRTGLSRITERRRQAGQNAMQAGGGAAFTIIFLIYGIPHVFMTVCLFIWLIRHFPWGLLLLPLFIMLPVFVLKIRNGNPGKRKKKDSREDNL